MKKNLLLRKFTFYGLLALFVLSLGKVQGQTAYTITYSSLTGSVAPSGVPSAGITAGSFNGVEATCNTNTNSGLGTYSTTLTAATGYSFTVTSVTASAFASGAGAKQYTLQAVGTSTVTGTATIIGTSSSNCGDP